MLLYTKGQRERPVSPKSSSVMKTTRRVHGKEYYLPGSISTLLGEMNLSHYTEGERNIQHFLKYGTYPTPPTPTDEQVGRWAGEQASRWADGQMGRWAGELFCSSAHPHTRSPAPIQWRRQALGETTKGTSWAIIGGLLLAGLILCKTF